MPEETYPGPATYSISSGEDAPPHSTLEVNGVQLEPPLGLGQNTASEQHTPEDSRAGEPITTPPHLAQNDPLCGWYDRMLAKNEHVQMLRNIPGIIYGELGEPFDVKAFRERCISNGYGSRETMETLFPDAEK